MYVRTLGKCLDESLTLPEGKLQLHIFNGANLIIFAKKSILSGA